MKNWFALCAISFVLALGCETSSYTVSIVNNSTVPVNFDYNGSSETLSKGESKSYSVSANTLAPVIDIPEGATPKVRLVRDGDVYTFEDIEITVYVVNRSSYEVTFDYNGPSKSLAAGASESYEVSANDTSEPVFDTFVNLVKDGRVFYFDDIMIIVSIKNNSSQTVDFSYNGLPSESLLKDAFKPYLAPAHTPAPDIDATITGVKVKPVTGGYEFE